MRPLFPYLMLYKRNKRMLVLGIVLAISTLLASISQKAISAWLLSASAVAGAAGLYSFNYMLPAAALRGVAIVRTVGRYFEKLVSHDTTFRILQHLRVFIFSRLISLSQTKLGHFRQGELLNRVVADVDTLDHLYLRVISPLLCTFVVILVMTLVMSILDLMLALTLGSIMFLILLLFPPFFYHISKPTGENLTRLRGEYRQQLIVWLQSQSELMLFNASQRYRAQMDSTELHWNRAQCRQSALSDFSQALMTLVSGIVAIIILWMASGGVGDNSKPGPLIALFVFCSLTSFEVLAPVIVAFQYLGQVLSSALRITQLTEQQSSVKFIDKCTQVPVRVGLNLENVTFFYDGQIQPALKDFTMEINPGEHIAILGRTGCGKSTLLQLITRAWDPIQGFIRINTISLSDFSESVLRHTMSVVTQRVHLFSATLRDNLLLAAPDANDLELSAVLQQVDLQKLLEGEGLNSWLGEGGRQLSGGELRRLAIARALLHDAPLMLLDEPTEGLDPTTESRILDLIKEITKDKTVLIVTHRLRGLANFDRIVVMDNGQLIEQGRHTELLAKRGLYYQLRQNL